MGNCNFSACCSRHILCHRHLPQPSSYLHQFISDSIPLPAQELMKTHSGDPEYLLFNASYVHHTSVLSLFFWVPYLRPGHISNQQYAVSSRGAGGGLRSLTGPHSALPGPSTTFQAVAVLTLASAVWATSRIFFTQSCSSSCESAATSRDQ